MREQVINSVFGIVGVRDRPGLVLFCFPTFLIGQKTCDPPDLSYTKLKSIAILSLSLLVYVMINATNVAI